MLGFDHNFAERGIHHCRLQSEIAVVWRVVYVTEHNRIGRNRSGGPYNPSTPETALWVKCSSP